MSKTKLPKRLVYLKAYLRKTKRVKIGNISVKNKYKNYAEYFSDIKVYLGLREKEFLCLAQVNDRTSSRKKGFYYVKFINRLILVFKSKNKKRRW